MSKKNRKNIITRIYTYNKTGVPVNIQFDRLVFSTKVRCNLQHPSFLSFSVLLEFFFFRQRKLPEAIKISGMKKEQKYST